MVHYEQSAKTRPLRSHVCTELRMRQECDTPNHEVPTDPVLSLVEVFEV